MPTESVAPAQCSDELEFGLVVPQLAQEDAMQTSARFFSAATMSVTLAFGAAALAAQGRPANATAECKDGTYSTATTKSGACSSHGGVKTWFADENKSKGMGGAAKDVGKATKDATATAGKSTAKGAETAGNATKDAAEATGKTTAKGAAAAGHATKEAAGSVKHAVTKRPADAPKDATGKCKDGTYSSATQHSGACSGHGGVAEWYQ